MIPPLAASWPSLREPFEASARSEALAADLAAALPARPRILNLAAETGEMFRWLAPRLARAQAWLLADEDEAVMAEAFERTADWARWSGWTVSYPGRAMLVHTPAGAWRLEAFAIDLAAAPLGLLLHRVDAVVCTAFLDRVSRAWLERLVGALRVPLYASLVADGRLDWLPRHPADTMIRVGMNRARSRGSGYGPPLGTAAPNAAIRALRTHGFAARAAPSDLRLPAGALGEMRAWVMFAADAASTALSGKQQAIAEWQALRLRQSLAAKLAVRIGQRDILGLLRQQ